MTDSMRFQSSIDFRKTGDARAGAIAQIGAIFLLSRIAWLVLSYWVTAYATVPQGVVQTGLVGALCRWDCGWYLGIAEHGYSAHEDPAQPGATDFAFFPLYPLLVRAAGPLFGGNLLPAAIAISNICFFAALIIVYRYARRVGGGHRAGLLTIALLCVLPHSLALSSAMSESVFLLLLAIALYCLRDGKALAAGTAAALLSATRAPGILFVLPALAYAIRTGGWRSLLQPWRAPEQLLPFVLAPLGLFAFWTYCFVATGDAFAQASTAQHGWGWTFEPPWTNLPMFLRNGNAAMLMAVGGVIVIACTVLLVRQGLIEDAIFCLAATLLVLGGTGTTSVFRYWIVLFPAWLGLARWAAPRPAVAAIILVIAAAANALMVLAWTTQSPLAL